MRSIRRRLLGWLLACVTLVAVAAGWGVYRAALVNLDELFDYQLQQLALALRDHGVGVDLPDPEASYEIVVQIWNRHGTRIYHSFPGSDLPEWSVLGFGNVKVGSGEWRVYSVQMRGRTIQVAQPMNVRRELARAHALRTMLPALLLVPLLAAALWFGVNRSLRPLSTVAREVGARDPDSLAPLSESERPDEILPLVHSLNDLLRRLSAALDAQRAFVADAAHELRSPITALRLQMQLHDRAPDPEARAAARTQLAAGIERASHLVDQLLTLARSDPGAAERQPVSVRLDDTARLAIGDVAALANARGVDLGLASADRATLSGDPEALRILVRNLVDNAVRYTPQGGRVDVHVRASDGRIILEVVDTGPGIPAPERERVFARFYRSDEGDAGGSGLGLAIVKAIADRHCASVELGDAPGHGLLVRVTFPAGAV